VGVVTAMLETAVTSEAYPEVRRRVFRQLLESMIFENIVPFQVSGNGSESTFSVAGADAQGAPVTYRGRGVRRSSFDRVRLSASPILRAAGGQPEEADSVAGFLLETAPAHGAAPERLLSFIAELEQTIVKDAQAQLHARQESVPVRRRSYDDIETGMVDGHPYHPCYKSRVGFDLEDNQRFGPEFSPSVRPVWVAAHRDWTRQAASAGLNVTAFLREEIGEPTWATWAREIQRRGATPDQYVLVPVHPWQWREQVAPLLFDHVRSRRLIPLGASPDAYRPQQSIRTLANLSCPRKASLKHALSIVNTSTSRILAPHTVENAPAISDWLHDIVASDPFLGSEARPIILREVLGAAYDPPEPEPLQNRSYGLVASIWRESLHLHLETGDSAAPWNALTHMDRDGRPLIEPWIQEHGIDPWVARLLEVGVLPVVHFLVRHGIALEAHAQNMVLVHRAGLPRRVALRDFHDGIRFAPEHLARPDRQPELRPTPERHARINRSSFLVASDPDGVRDFVLDALLFVNLSELAMFLADRFAYSEDRFWNALVEQLRRHRTRFPDLAPRFDLFGLAAPTIVVERLTSRRLFPEDPSRMGQAAPNPLRRLGLHAR
jgi:2-[(L-alanin-3-ylcarbamoyl)methyl]-3-(2-aminoethylcarbamoyl)-2-hydroxypropanoate synthase